MTVNELIEELAQYDSELEVGVVVSVQGPCNCEGYCYCSSEDREFYIESVSKESEKKTKKIKKLWIRVG